MHQIPKDVVYYEAGPLRSNLPDHFLSSYIIRSIIRVDGQLFPQSGRKIDNVMGRAIFAGVKTISTAVFSFDSDRIRIYNSNGDNLRQLSYQMSEAIQLAPILGMAGANFATSLLITIFTPQETIVFVNPGLKAAPSLFKFLKTTELKIEDPFKLQERLAKSSVMDVTQKYRFTYPKEAEKLGYPEFIGNVGAIWGE